MAEISVDLTKLDPDPLNMYVKTMTRRVLEYAQREFPLYIIFQQQEHYFQFYNKGRENTR